VKKLTKEACNPINLAFIISLFFSLTLLSAYSIIPYKTPWCSLQLHIPILLCAFLGLEIFAKRGNTQRSVTIFLSMLLLGANCNLLAQMWKDPDSKTIPYNYASASPQVKDMATLIKNIVSEKSAPTDSFVAVALPAEDTWPLPFYLRGLNAQIGYWTQFEELEVLSALNRKPDIVVVPAEQGHLIQPLFPYLKNTRRFEMRHRVRIRIFW
jgi:hypothetical protein